MKKSERIKKLADLEAIQGAEIESRLQRAQRNYLEACRKLKQLETYRLEYADQFHSTRQEGMSANRLADFSRFVQQLDQALDTQRESVEQQRFRLDQVRAAWQKNYQKIDGLNRVSASAKKAEQKVESKRAYRQLEDRFALLDPQPLAF